MRAALDPFSLLVTSLAGWMNQHQQHVIEYLMEENRVLREQIGNRRLRFSDDQRRSIGRESEDARAKAPRTGVNHRYSRNTPGVAPKIDRTEI